MQAAFATADITPPAGTKKIGWLQEITITEFRDPLCARVALFEVDGEFAAFVQLDTLSVRWTQVQEIRRRAEARCGVPGGRIMVAGHANGMVGYVPTREAFGRGGYETTFLSTSRLAPEAGDILAGAAIDLIRKGYSR